MERNTSKRLSYVLLYCQVFQCLANWYGSGSGSGSGCGVSGSMVFLVLALVLGFWFRGSGYGVLVQENGSAVMVLGLRVVMVCYGLLLVFKGCSDCYRFLRAVRGCYGLLGAVTGCYGLLRVMGCYRLLRVMPELFAMDFYS